MSLLRHRGAGAIARALLAAAGALAAVGFSAWPLATACFAALSALALAEARGARGRELASRALSTPDPLTGVGTYRALHERLHEATAADPQRFALLTLDVDGFNEIDEAHGQLEGDRLLQQVGRVLRESVRGADIVTRQGGHELSVLLPDADEDGASMLARRIEEALRSIEAADHAPVRASIGVAVYPRDGVTPADLLEKAEVELRRSRQRRRAELTR